jgi:very-short-patch-repair endonuclease
LEADTHIDFYCHELMLVIEVDGESHTSAESVRYDKVRQENIEKHGVRFLRFDDLDVKKNIAHVLDTIEAWIIDLS